MTNPIHIPPPPGDFVLPFDLPALGMRGRLVRLDKSSARALRAHQLPEPAARLAGESLALAALLGTALKLDGRLTVQTKSDGPLDLITADYYGAEEEIPAGPTPAGIRGYARLDAERFKTLAAQPAFPDLAGTGALAITIEPRRGGNAYQGIVELAPEGLAASAEIYFTQSEQLPTSLRLAAAPVFIPGDSAPQWRAGGLMLQMTPQAARDEEAWERLTLFLKTVEDLELVDTLLKGEDLLWRLFHEDEVRVHPAEALTFRCDCSTERIEQVLQAYSEEDRASLADPDGLIRARCEFCGTVHEIKL